MNLISIQNSCYWRLHSCDESAITCSEKDNPSIAEFYDSLMYNNCSNMFNCTYLY